MVKFVEGKQYHYELDLTDKGGRKYEVIDGVLYAYYDFENVEEIESGMYPLEDKESIFSSAGAFEFQPEDMKNIVKLFGTLVETKYLRETD